MAMMKWPILKQPRVLFTHRMDYKGTVPIKQVYLRAVDAIGEEVS